MISIIAAASENNVIGNENKLLWHLPADLKFFKSTTSGHPMIMGRKTFESIGKPLPGRATIIITRQDDYKPDGVIVVHSLKEALKEAEKIDEEVFIVGGGEIYKQAMFLVDRIYLTRVFATYNGDTHFQSSNSAKTNTTT